MVTCGATSGYDGRTDIRYVFSKGLSILGSTMGGRAELLTIAGLVADRRLRPVIDRVLPLDRVAEGHRAMADRNLFGKIILKPRKVPRSRSEARRVGAHNGGATA